MTYKYFFCDYEFYKNTSELRQYDVGGGGVEWIAFLENN